MALVPFPGAAKPAPDDDDDRHIHLTDPDALEDAGAKMSFLDHLDELRKRLIACVWGLIGGCAIGFLFVGRIQDFIWRPLYNDLQNTSGVKFMYTAGFEPFMLTMKIGALAGLMADGGRWDGTPVLPDAWVADSLAPKGPATWRVQPMTDIGYGLLWFTGRLHGQRVAWAWGYGAQFALIAPDLKLVVATAATSPPPAAVPAQNEAVMTLVGRLVQAAS